MYDSVNYNMRYEIIIIVIIIIIIIITIITIIIIVVVAIVATAYMCFNHSTTFKMY